MITKRYRWLVAAIGLSAATFAVAGFEEGVEAYQRGDYPAALQQWRPLAEGGDAHAQCNLGILYTYGHGVPRDDAQAVKWYQLAAEQGNGMAQYNLGYMHRNGRGTPKDAREAAKWYRMAAGKGRPEAQFNLGTMYYNGEGVAEDRAKAVKWFRRAAEQGHLDARRNLDYLGDDGLTAQVDAPTPPPSAIATSKAPPVLERPAPVTTSVETPTRAPATPRGEGITQDPVEALRHAVRAVHQDEPGAEQALRDSLEAFPRWRAKRTGSYLRDGPTTTAKTLQQTREAELVYPLRTAGNGWSEVYLPSHHAIGFMATFLIKPESELEPAAPVAAAAERANRAPVTPLNNADSGEAETEREVAQEAIEALRRALRAARQGEPGAEQALRERLEAFPRWRAKRTGSYLRGGPTTTAEGLQQTREGELVYRLRATGFGWSEVYLPEHHAIGFMATFLIKPEAP